MATSLVLLMLESVSEIHVKQKNYRSKKEDEYALQLARMYK
jgi:hypothetical protein